MLHALMFWQGNAAELFEEEYFEIFLVGVYVCMSAYLHVSFFACFYFNVVSKFSL